MQQQLQMMEMALQQQTVVEEYEEHQEDDREQQEEQTVVEEYREQQEEVVEAEGDQQEGRKEQEQQQEETKDQEDIKTKIGMGNEIVVAEEVIEGDIAEAREQATGERLFHQELLASLRGALKHMLNSFNGRVKREINAAK
jgi:hypothetical protein